jgi:hypothetical protein
MVPLVDWLQINVCVRVHGDVAAGESIHERLIVVFCTMCIEQLSCIVSIIATLLQPKREEVIIETFCEGVSLFYVVRDGRLMLFPLKSMSGD